MIRNDEKVIVDELYEILDSAHSMRDCCCVQGMNEEGWFRPMDIGGSDGSKHSIILRKLFKLGYVERFERSLCKDRHSYLYRITDSGKAMIENKISH